MVGGAWDLYETRITTKGETLRSAKQRRETEYINRKLSSSLSYYTVTVDGVEQQLAILNNDNLNEKTICSMPGESIVGGSIVIWKDNHWIVLAVDANNEIYTKAVMGQCNYIVRWIAEDGKIVERWCIISDGTKYLTGETMSSYNDNGMSLGDTRISMTIPRDEYTTKLNRSNRFLIDDYSSNSVLAYRLTKPFKIGGVYNGHGAMNFVLTEVNTEDDDNLELHIADYYKHFPRKASDTSVVEQPQEDGGRRNWL